MEHYWRSLPGPVWFSATSIYKQQVARARPKAAFVELGAWKGRSTVFMAVEIINSGKDIDFYTVDHWLGSAETEHHRDADAIAGRLFSVFMANIAPVRSHVIPIQGVSTEVAANFADNSVDFIYLDAGHDYASVRADLEAWWPKLHPEGIIAGDDWCFVDHDNQRSVARAVSEFFAPLNRRVVIEPGEPNPDWSQWIVEKGQNS